MTSYDFAKLQDETDLERAIGVVFDEAHGKWTDSIPDDESDDQRCDILEVLTEGQITVLAVETYFGEVLNGGHYQYFSNESGGLANYAPAALRRVGLGEFAPVVAGFIALFPDGRVPEDSEVRQESLDRIADQYDDAFFERLESQFDKLYHRRKTREQEKLFSYIVNHKEQFVTD
jgi:hypothetical protein